MNKSWDSLTPRELRNAKIISVAFLIISILIFVFLSKIVGAILLFLWIISGSGPFILGSKGSMKNKIHVLKMVEHGYNDWQDEEIIEQIKAIEECGYKWFEQKGRVGFKHTKTGLYLKMEGLHFYKPEEIKRTYEEVWSKDDPKQAKERDIFNSITQEAMSDKFVLDILSIGGNEKVSNVEYMKAVAVGKNRVVAFFSKEENNEIVTKKYFDRKEVIVTISNNVLIVTKEIRKKQTPILVKKWKKVDDNSPSLKHGLTFQHGIEYEDSSGNTWLYLKSSGLESLNMENETGKRFTFIFE